MPGSRVMLVEDERILALNLEQQLSRLGYDVVDIASSGQRALNRIEDLHPDIVLMDINIEGAMDGIETAARIPQDYWIPVIYMTAYSDEATLARARPTRPYGYLVKPFSERELHATIQMALERSKVEIALSRKEKNLQDLTGQLRQEIAERQRAQLVLQETSDLLQATFDAAPFPIIVSIPDRRVLMWNKAATRDFGFAAVEITGNSMMTLFPEDERAAMENFLAGAPRAAPLDMLSTRIRRRDGKLREVRMFNAPVFDGAHRIRAMVTTAEDVTDRIAVEAQLRQAQKMEAIGQLTGGIAHDFNNLLAIIQGNLELICEVDSDNPHFQDMAGDALRAARRGASLTHRLLAFSRRQPLNPDQVDVGQLVNGVMDLLRRSLGETIQIRTIFPENLWDTRIDPDQLVNAIVNLAVNARDAMPEGGRLTIEACNTLLDQDYADLNAEVTPGDYVQLTVSDTGTGMDRATLEQALEPFFTTKPVGAGSGLGLSMVFGFVKQSGGHLKLYSEPDHGTSVKLYLPRAIQLEPVALSGAGAAAQAVKTGETILVVEDDEAVRRLSVRFLQALGYSVIEAGDGPAALALLDQGARIDLLFTDIVLPLGMKGPDLAQRAQGRLPGLKVLFMSGYTSNSIVHDGRLDAGVHLLTKPFTKAALAQKLRELLDTEGEDD